MKRFDNSQIPTMRHTIGGIKEEKWEGGQWDERELLDDEDSYKEEEMKYFEIDHIKQKVVKRFGSTVTGGGLNSSRVSQSSISNPFKIAKPLSQNFLDALDSPKPEEEDDDAFLRQHQSDDDNVI
jgi:hypothetical protein